MEPAPAFPHLIHRVRAGEEAAATELVQLYAPEVRRAIRLCLTDPRLKRKYDSVDICQSVLANFFVKVIGGAYDLDEPSQLVRLLVTMARNKLVDHTRKPSHRKETDAEPQALDECAGREDTPSRVVSQQELTQAVRDQLTDEERRIAEERVAGREWAEIAVSVGGTPDGVRKKLDRAVARVCDRLGLDGVEHA